MVYAGWLQTLAKQALRVAGLRAAAAVAGGDRFVAVHVRLGDWARGHGCVNCTFASERYASTLKQLVQRHGTRVRSNGGGGVLPRIFVATESSELPQVKHVLQREGFKVVTSATIAKALVERTAAQFGRPPTEDVVSCVEQLICCQAGIFVGTPGSTWSDYVKAVRNGAHLPTRWLSPLRFMEAASGVPVRGLHE